MRGQHDNGQRRIRFAKRFGTQAKPVGRPRCQVLQEDVGVRDEDGYRLKSALRKVIEQFQPEVRLTASQNLLLVNVPSGQTEAITRILTEHGVSVENPFSPTRLASMACPALPTCGLALAESERVLPDLISRFEELLAGAAEGETEDERAAYLAAHAGDEGLRGEVLAMLAAHGRTASDGVDGWLVRAAVPPPATTLAGTCLGPWRLLQPLGEGGMGEVYLAERADGQFEQTVAVKLLRAGHDDPAWVARFRTEREILARLEHPNIARLLDGGGDLRLFPADFGIVAPHDPL